MALARVQDPRRVAARLAHVRGLRTGASRLLSLAFGVIDNEQVEEPPGALEMELTESVVAAGGAAFAATLRDIRRPCATIAIDDFGTGYSSLAYLKQFQVDKVKVDQTFIRDIVSEPDDAAT